MRQALTGTRVRERRLLLGMKQAELARVIGVSPAYLNLIEHNRRRVGPEVLEALALALGVEAATLAEGAEGALFDMLREAAATVQPPSVAPEVTRIEDFVSRFPGWSELLAARQTQVVQMTRTIEQLSERMAQDPFLAASLHEVLSAITAVRSTAAILAETEDIAPEWRTRFHHNILSDSVRLSNVSAAIVAWLDQLRAPETGLAAPQEELEAWLAARGWFFPELEGTGSADTDRLTLGAAELVSEAARSLARDHLRQYRADVMGLSLPALATALARVGPDPARLAATLDRPMAQVLRRLAVLPLADARPDAPAHLPEGAAYVACDGSGTLTFRRPAAGFPFPRFGAACALWPLYEALGQPFTPVRRLLATSGRGAGARFVAFAWAERAFPAGFDGPQVLKAQMLVLPAAADQHEVARTVGSTCRVCTESACPARREPSILT